MGNCSISIVMNGIKKCSGLCLYCSAASTMNYRDKANKNTFVFNKEKLKARIMEFCDEQIKMDRKNNIPTMLAIDIWGGNPVENFEPFKTTVEFCENELKEFKEVTLHTSGNGLELQDNDLVEYLITHNIHYQLSHDGLGQWIRTGDIDPLYWDKTKDNVTRLARLGIIDWINCTLTARNPSFFDNIEYWNKWRKSIGVFDNGPDLTIKLNHIYDGTPPITKKWLGKDNDYIKHGEEVGDLCFHGEVLQNYLQEFRKLAIICMTPGIEKNRVFTPYVNYIRGQADRYKIIKDASEAGSCVAFQRGLKDKNFAIDTKGEYCQCNLIDSDSKVKNAKAKQPDYCKGCKYEKLGECNSCGSENYPEKCEYHWWWAKTLEEMFQLLQLCKTFDTIIHNSQAHSCKDGSCDCKKKSDPVFCVRNYNF